MRRPWSAPILVLCLGSFTSAAPAQDATLARNLAAACFTCHGTNGNAQPGMASLAGRPQAEIVRIMGEFRSGARGGEQGTLMPQIVKGYTEEQIALIADYFSHQKPAVGKP